MYVDDIEVRDREIWFTQNARFSQNTYYYATIWDKKTSYECLDVLSNLIGNWSLVFDWYLVEYVGFNCRSLAKLYTMSMW